jgi:3-oxosteroid 1-dehydrogenase
MISTVTRLSTDGTTKSISPLDPYFRKFGNAVLGLICRFVAALRERGVPMLTTQPVDRLALDGGRVTGVVMGSGELIAARRGVLLATGGYGADPQMSWEFEQLPGFAHEGSGLIPQSLTGDGLVLGAEIGGIVNKVENSLRVMLSYRIPAEIPGGTATSVHAGIIELCSPHRHGRRFADETFFQGIVPQLRLFDPARHEYPNLPAYLIFDAQYLERFSFANRPIGSAVPRTVACADTLSELATMLRIDVGGLHQTVRRFNGFAASGADEDFHRGEHQWKLASRPKQPGNGSLGTVEKPPFYGIELHPAGGSSAGLLTDVHARVIHQRRRPISGLYASGNATAATEQGIGYQAGL